MGANELDEIDRGILHLLQQDARNFTPVDMAKELPVSEGTVRNRIKRMEDRGIIQGYVPTIDYEAAGFPLEVLFTCTVPSPKLGDIAEDILQVNGIINVRELMSGRGNLQVIGLATGLSDIMSIASELTERDVEIESQRLTLDEYVQPFNHLGGRITQDDTE